MPKFELEYQIPEEAALKAEFIANADISNNGDSVIVGNSFACRKPLALRFLDELGGNSFRKKWYALVRSEKRELITFEAEDRDGIISLLAEFEAAKAVRPEDTERAITAALKAEVQRREAMQVPMPE